MAKELGLRDSVLETRAASRELAAATHRTPRCRAAERIADSFEMAMATRRGEIARPRHARTNWAARR
jgi:hypothetical protein